ncbi:MAG: NCS2 family permease [Clostridiales bacterium]|nr:NCS2 family permease [Clostridiales bacterium]
MKDFLEKHFTISKRNTKISTEILAGFTTFATMAYILAVQPAIMGDAGMNTLGVFAATALISGLVTIAMGFYSNTPLALAPGMGTNLLMAYVVVAGGIATWQISLGMMFISGIAFLILSIFNVREKIADFLPKSIKFGLSGALGIMLFQIAIANSNLLLPENAGWNDFSLPEVKLTLIGLAITLFLNFIKIRINGREYKVRGAMLLSIIITTLIGIPMGLVSFQAGSGLNQTLSAFGDVAFKLDIAGALRPEYIGFIVIFFIGDFCSTMGTALGTGHKAGLMDKDGNMPMLGKIFLVDAAGTIAGTLTGVTVVTSYIESAAGIEAGGRTGLTSLVTGLMFIVSIILAPLFIAIPTAATAPVLIVIGISMMQELRTVSFEMIDWTPVAIMMGFTAFADLGTGITVGLISDIIIRICAYAFDKENRKGNLPGIPTIIFAALMCLQYVF